MLWAALIASALMLPQGAPVPRARVLFFVASDCPYSDRYFPEMLRLKKEFAGSGVSFTWIYPNRNETLAAAQAHQQTFSAPTADIDMDPGGKLTRQARVHITPEAAVLVESPGGTWTVAYHGRIDDRYVRLGVERPHAGRHDLENAISAVLHGKQASPAAGSAVGCTIMAATP